MSLPFPLDASLPDRALPATEEKRRCRHCGNTFQPRFQTEHFCCSGCRVVHDLIETGGFGSFYELLGRRVLQPADNGDPAADHLEEIAAAFSDAETESGKRDVAAQLTLRVGNLSCTACVWLIDHLFHRHPGALKIASNTTRSTLTLWWSPGEFDLLAFVRDLHRYGYPAGLVDELAEDAPAESRSLLTRLGVTGGLAMNTMAFTLPSYLGLETSDDLSRLFTLVAFASATLALAVGGSYFFQRAWSALRVKALHMDVPISLGLIAAWLGSVGGLAFRVEDMLYFDFVAMFAFLMLSGRWLHLRLLEKNRRQLWARERDLSSAWRLVYGVREKVSLTKVEQGDTLEIPAGGMIPVNSRLSSPSADLLLDWINGEPEPVPFLTGQEIPAGARNGSGRTVNIVAIDNFSGSFLEQLLAPGGETAAEPVAAHPILKYYLSLVIAIAAIGFSAWLIGGNGIAKSLQVLISILVVSCPCAIGLALPLLDEMLLSKLKQHGIFIRRHSLWNRLKAVRVLAFDKTGTLTEPVKRLSDPGAIESLDREARGVLRCLTAHNRHPVGKALSEVLTARFGPGPEQNVVHIQEFPGRGVSCRIGGGHWRLGRHDWACGGHEKDSEGGCVLSKNGVEIARFQFEEAVRDGAATQMESLRRRGFQLRILSGDPDTERVRRTASQLGIEPKNVYANLSPEEKADLIRQGGGAATLFVGDGGNDGLAFQAAGVGGAPATGIRAIESRADFVFTGRGFHAIGLLLDAAGRKKRLVATIFTLALAYNLGAIALCLAGLMNPLLAAVLMPLSSIVTTAIATRV